MNFYQYFLLIFTVIVITEIIFSVAIRPYYSAKVFNEHISEITLPEVSIEAIILLTIILGLAISKIVNVHPFLYIGSIFLVYGFASLNQKFAFYIASALLFNFYRSMPYKSQMQKQKIIITCCFFITSALFYAGSFYPGL